jgi:Rhodopirellula transposase DDE domain
MAEAATYTACGYGKLNFRIWSMSSSFRLPSAICRLVPSKWNKIEHALFSFISINWRGKPLRTYRTIVQLIMATTTDTGLTVRAELDKNKYLKGIKVSDAQMVALNLSRHAFHGDWNYTLSPIRKNPTRRK